MCSTLTRISTSPTRCWQACHSPLPHPSPPRGGLITRQFLGELEVRQILPPLLQVPPAGGGNQTAVPLAKQGEPNGGGLQKVSCNEGGGGRSLCRSAVHDGDWVRIEA
jgi:hypothetical protein